MKKIEVKNPATEDKTEQVTIQAEEVIVNAPMERNAPDTGAKAMLPEDIQAVVNENKKVVAGRHVITGETTYKDAPVVKAPRDWSEGRKLFPVHKAITGSLNGRKFDMKVGDEVYLNADELKLFRMYVSGAGK